MFSIKQLKIIHQILNDVLQSDIDEEPNFLIEVRTLQKYVIELLKEKANENQ